MILVLVALPLIGLSIYKRKKHNSIVIDILRYILMYTFCILSISALFINILAIDYRDRRLNRYEQLINKVNTGYNVDVAEINRWNEEYEEYKRNSNNIWIKLWYPDIAYSNQGVIEVRGLEDIDG